MNSKYNIEIETDVFTEYLKRLTNQIYKLLPSREEGLDWKKPLITILEELAGTKRLLMSHQLKIFTLMCKLEGLFILEDEKYFFLFRKTIFECLNIIGEMIKNGN